MRAVALLLALVLAGCVDDAMRYEATFAAVPGESGKYTLKVLNATLDNVTVEITAPSRPNPVAPRGDEGVVTVRRESAGFVLLELTVDHVLRPADPVVPTWTVRIDDLRRNSYTVDAIVTTRICGDDGCTNAALGEVKNVVKVT